MQNEPSLDQIDDYNDNESPEKRKTIIKVVVFLLLIGVIFTAIKVTNTSSDPYVGTEQNPGISTFKK